MTLVPRFVREGRGLAALAAATVAVMVAVILWGAVVRITSSGGGCGSHWPLCNGDFFPHHPRLATIIEFTHRATTGVCSTLALAVLAWTFLASDTSRRARIAAVVAVALLFVEAFLGRALVIHGYVENNISDARSVMQCVHFTNTMALLAAFTLTWWFLRQPQRADEPRRSAAIGLLAVVSSLAAGATGAVAALADTLFPSPSLRAGLAADFAANAPLLVRMRWIHPAAAVFTFVFAVWLALRLRHRGGSLLLGLLAAQIVLGGLDVLLLAPGWLQILHLLGADLFWIVLVVLAWESAASPQGHARSRHAAGPYTETVAANVGG